MALRDVKLYYMKMLNQYLEVKNDLTDFEQALRDGHITEEQLTAAKEDVEYIKSNVDRLSYIMFLFDIPSRKGRKKKYLSKNADLVTYFDTAGSSESEVLKDNTDVLQHLRTELKNLRELNPNEEN